MDIEKIKNSLPENVEFKQVVYYTKINEHTLRSWCCDGRYRRNGKKNEFYMPKEDVMSIMDKNKYAISGWIPIEYITKDTGINYNTIKNWCYKKMVRAEKDIRGRWLIHPEDVERIKKASGDSKISNIMLIGLNKYYSLVKTARDLTKINGIEENDTDFYKEFEKNYKNLYQMIVIAKNDFNYTIFGEIRKRIFITENVYNVMMNMIKISDAKKMVDVSRRTIYDWIESKKIKFYRTNQCDGFFIRGEWIEFIKKYEEKKKIREKILAEKKLINGI